MRRGFGRIALIADVSDLLVSEMPGIRELRTAGARSLIVVNLQARGQCFGTLTFVGHASRPAYDAQDLKLAEETAFRVASALAHERRMRVSERALHERQEMLAVVCHELREPLAAVSLGAQVMLQRPSGSDRRQSRKAIEAIQRSASRMGHLVGDLVDSSSLSGGHLSIRRDWHSLSSIVGEAIEAQALSSSRKSLALRVELPTAPRPVYCDRHRILQVLGNLLANAIKFTAHEGAIALLVRQVERETIFSVTDSGRGISPADQQHIFDRYWHTRADNRDGTGLGLYITKGIVEAHGGRIWVASQLHQWSVFSFTIPHGPPRAPSSD